ncbi:MAG: hypothetical protein PVSMB6_10480 [Steroidobacteraceae bacterium]
MDRTPAEGFSQSGELNDYNLFRNHAALVDACAHGEGLLLAATAHAALLQRCFAPAAA